MTDTKALTQAQQSGEGFYVHQNFHHCDARVSRQLVSHNRDQRNEGDHERSQAPDPVGQTRVLEEDAQVEQAQQPQGNENSAQWHHRVLVQWDQKMPMIEFTYLAVVIALLVSFFRSFLMLFS